MYAAENRACPCKVRHTRQLLRMTIGILKDSGCSRKYLVKILYSTWQHCLNVSEHKKKGGGERENERGIVGEIPPPSQKKKTKGQTRKEMTLFFLSKNKEIGTLYISNFHSKVSNRWRLGWYHYYMSTKNNMILTYEKYVWPLIHRFNNITYI